LDLLSLYAFKTPQKLRFFMCGGYKLWYTHPVFINQLPPTQGLRIEKLNGPFWAGTTNWTESAR
jgi:hypothetical protein